MTYTAKALEQRFDILPHSLPHSVDEEFDDLIQGTFGCKVAFDISLLNSSIVMFIATLLVISGKN